jgi:hypothetical protein
MTMQSKATRPGGRPNPATEVLSVGLVLKLS